MVVPIRSCVAVVCLLAVRAMQATAFGVMTDVSVPAGPAHDPVPPAVVAPLDAFAAAMECVGQMVVPRDRRDQGEYPVLVVDHPTTTIEFPVDPSGLM